MAPVIPGGSTQNAAATAALDHLTMFLLIRRQRRRAFFWLLGGAILAAVGAATFVNATENGGYIWGGAIFVGFVIMFRALRLLVRLGRLR